MRRELKKQYSGIHIFSSCPFLLAWALIQINMYYYLTIRNFVCGSGEYGRPETDDNQGHGYTLEEARKKQKELHTLKSIGRCLDGTEVTIFSFKGELVS